MEDKLVGMTLRAIEVTVRVVIACLLVVLAHLSMEIFDTVIIGTILICNHMAFILIDSGSTFSLVPVTFAIGRDIVCKYLDTSMHVCTPIGVFVSVD